MAMAQAARSQSTFFVWHAANNCVITNYTCSDIEMFCSMLLNITNLPTKRKDLNDVFLTQSVRLARGGAPKPPKRRRKTARKPGASSNQVSREVGGADREGRWRTSRLKLHLGDGGL